MSIFDVLYKKYQGKRVALHRKKIASKKRGASGKPRIDPNILFTGRENFRLETSRYRQKTGRSIEAAMPRELYWQGNKIKGKDFYRNEIMKYVSKGKLRERQFKEWMRRNGVRTKDSKRILELFRSASSRYAMVQKDKKNAYRTLSEAEKKERSDRAVDVIGTVKAITGFASPKSEHIKEKSSISVEEIKKKQGNSLTHLGIQNRNSKHRNFMFGAQMENPNRFVGGSGEADRSLTRGPNLKPPSVPKPGGLSTRGGQAKPSVGIGIKKM